jgi:uncharacterized protein YfaP (DUF2135 family)/pimeloyl-ACP methyl ester carboxylesterase
LSAPVGALKQQYTFKYYAGVDESGRLLSRYKTTPEATAEEYAALNLITPDSDTLIANYLTSVATPSASSRMAKAAPINYGNTTFATGIPTACKENGKWPDYNGDGFVFDHMLQAKDALYHDVAGWDAFGAPRVYAKSWAFDDEIQCSSRLWSKDQPSKESNKEPILFVHGFIKSGNLGGFDGEEYFAKFPQLISQYEGGKYQPYLFEWRTNARFEDVAEELGDAVKLITEKTGKKVRIVAHSYGGLLSRTLIQGLAAQRDPNDTNAPAALHPEYTHEWAEQHIATLTTVGTPHSGVSDGGDGLPNGRDGSAGAAIALCYAITCYQAGRLTDHPTTVYIPNVGFVNVGAGSLHPKRSSTLTSSGKIIKRLLETEYPRGVYTQVLIGLGGFNDYTLLGVGEDTTTDASDIQITCAKTTANKCKLYYSKSNNGDLGKQGDGLISFYGQRFYPQMLGQSLIDGSNLKEHILGFDAFWSAEQMQTAFDDKFVKDDKSDRRLPDSPQFFEGREISYGSGFRQTLEDVGVYNHRTGQYLPVLRTDGNGITFGNADKAIEIRQFSEVGLQNCTSSTSSVDCPHATWKYFVAEALPVSVENAALVPNIAVSGRLNFPNNDIAPIGTYVTILAGSNILVQAPVATDGSFNTPVSFAPNTNYILRVETTGYRAKFIKGEELGATTRATVAESSLNFGVINMESKDFAEGDMKVVVTDAVTGRSVSGYKVTAYNSVNNGVDNRDEQQTTATPTPTLTTLPKGSYRVEIEKAGYQTAKQVCDVKETQLVTCQINIVPTTSVSEGQLVSVLRWDVNPNDLDSHLIKYNANGQQQYHIYYSNRNGGTDNLDVDDTTSYGPETVTINQLDPTANYVYAIYHYGGSGSITTTSQAQVSVLQNGKPVRIYKAPLTGEGRWWKVFEVQNGQVIPCQSNCMYSSEPQPTFKHRGKSRLFQIINNPIPPIFVVLVC